MSIDLIMTRSASSISPRIRLVRLWGPSIEDALRVSTVKVPVVHFLGTAVVEGAIVHLCASPHSFAGIGKLLTDPVNEKTVAVQA